MSQEKFWVLFSKKLAGEANAEELVELESLVQQHPEWQYAIQNLEDIWKHQAPEDFSEEEDAYMLHLPDLPDHFFRYHQLFRIKIDTT